jgi:hypothetical protein
MEGNVIRFTADGLVFLASLWKQTSVTEYETCEKKVLTSSVTYWACHWAATVWRDI